MYGTASAGLALGPPSVEHEGARIAPRQVPAALRAFWADGLFAAAQDAFIVAYLPLLAASLGASGTQIGLLAGAQSLGSMLALYPGAVASRRASSRRWVVVFYAGVLGRLTLFLSAFTIAFTGGDVALYTVTALLTLRAFLTSFVVPAWTSVAADVIPPGLRARYFASRNFAASVAVLAVTPLGGLVLDRFGFPGGYVVGLLVSFVLGMCATLAYARIPEPPAATRGERTSRRAGRAILRDRPFVVFVGATFAVHFATMLAGPFFSVYLVHNLGGSNFTVGLLSTASAFAGIIGQLCFGEVMSRRGALWVSRVATVAMPALPLMWIFAGNPWWVLLPNIAGGVLWAAFNLANFQLLLEVTAEDERDDYVAAFHICVFGALFLAPFAGGFIIDQWGYRLDFALSAIGRVLAAAMFLYVVSTPAARRRARWQRRLTGA